MEELSFKPLSEGLGFYKKKQPPSSAGENIFHQPKEDTLSLPDLPEDVLTEVLDLDDSKTYERLLSMLEKPYLGNNMNNMGFKQEHNRFSFSLNSPAPSPSASSLILTKSSHLKKNGRSFMKKEDTPVRDETNKKPVPVNSVAQASGKSLPDTCFEKTFYCSSMAYLADTFVICLLFAPPFVLFVFLTQTNLMDVLWFVWPEVLLSFLIFSQIYCLLCRLFCFETFGEALAKIRLCAPHSPGEVHPFRLFWRFLLSCVTGVIFFPLLSFIFKKDLMARLTGLHFQKI